MKGLENMKKIILIALLNVLVLWLSYFLPSTIAAAVNVVYTLALAGVIGYWIKKGAL